MFGYIFSHFTSFAKILLILFIYYCIYTYILVKNNRAYIDLHWDQFRCKPYIIPITFLFGRPKGYNPIDGTIQNANSCFWKMANELSIPRFNFIGPMLQGLIDILKSLGNSMNSLKGMIYGIYHFLLKIAWDVQKRMENMQQTMTYNFLKMYNAFKRMNSAFVMNMFLMETLITSFTSMSNSFVRTMANFASSVGIGMTYFLFGVYAEVFFPKLVDPFIGMCFTAHTPITLLDRSKISIESIYNHRSLGILLYGNGIVESILKFSIQNTNKRLYSYNNIILSGHHMVYENNIPLRVKDSSKSKCIETDEDFLYCLITNNRKIYIENNWYADFMESDDIKTTLTTYQFILEKLNQTKHIIKTDDDINHLYQWGLGINTYIKMKDYSIKKIQDIQIGDETLYGTVSGTIIHDAKNIKMFKYKDHILSGSQAVFENGIWLRVHQSKYASITKYDHKEIYTITVDTNRIELNHDILITDYFEINEDSQDMETIHNLNLQSMISEY